MFLNIDRAIFYFINHSLSSPFLNFIMPLFSAIADGPIIFVAAFLLLFSRKKELRILGIILLAGMTMEYYAVSGIKALVARPRPSLAMPDVILLAKAYGASFPSGHAALSFMAVFVISAHIKKYRAIIYILACAIAISRVYVGVHYPSDIFAGAIIGTIIGLFLNRFHKEWFNW